MPTIQDIRRQNLRSVIDGEFKGTPAHLAQAIGCTATSVSRLYSEAASRRNIGDKMARAIEQAARLPEGWMDTPHQTLPGELARVSADLTPAELQATIAFVDALKARR